MLSYVSSQMSGKLGKHVPRLNIMSLFLFQPEILSLDSIYVVAPISSHKGITMKRQNGILSTVSDRGRRDGVGAERGWEGGRNRIVHLSAEPGSTCHRVLFPSHIPLITTQRAGTKENQSVVSRENFDHIYFTSEFLSLRDLSGCCHLQRTSVLLSQS